MALPGLTLYTKKTRSMLNQMERVGKCQAQRKGPPKFGPKTKEEHEEKRVSWIDDVLAIVRINSGDGFPAPLVPILLVTQLRIMVLVPLNSPFELFSWGTH